MDDEAQNKVVRQLNEASLTSDVDEKISLLTSVQTMLNGSHQLMEAHINTFLAFGSDQNVNVRKFVVTFIEETVKKNIELFPTAISCLSTLLEDASPLVQKRVIQCLTQLYNSTLIWILNANPVSEKMLQTWNEITNMKTSIIAMIDSDNDGLKTQVMKFFEVLVLLQTQSDPENAQDNDFNLNDIPLTSKVIQRQKLEEEAFKLFDLLIEFHGTQHITSANLITCMGSLSSIAKRRPFFAEKVLNAFENLSNNLPPTLLMSQVNAVEKHLKMILLGLLRNPMSDKFMGKIKALLEHLGAWNNDVIVALAKKEEMRKRMKKYSSEVKTKKIKLEDLKEVSESFITERLTPELAVDLIEIGMSTLPDVMPESFRTDYKLLKLNEGIEGQMKIIAQHLAKQFNDSKLDSGPSISKTGTNLKANEEVINIKNEAEIPEKDESLSEESREALLLDVVLRILQSEGSLEAEVGKTQRKILANLAASSIPSIRETIMSYILADLQGQLQLALCWLFEEYSILQGFAKRLPLKKEPDDRPNYYNTLLSILLNQIINNKEMTHREGTLMRICLEVPRITPEMIDLLKGFSATEVFGSKVLKELILLRPPHQKTLMAALLENSSLKTAEIRDASIIQVADLYRRDILRGAIRGRALSFLRYLTQLNPPECLFVKDPTESHANWTDKEIEACLCLFLAILPINHGLIHELAKVYAHANANVKRTILILVENPVKGMDMNSDEVLSLVEECPEGSETFVTRLIRILTSNVPPSNRLVDRVLNLYRRRDCDVRCLMPVLIGLDRNEVISVLPEIIKLKPNYVTEAFNRLFYSYRGRTQISPAELLIALHLINPPECDWKAIMNATSICFADRRAFNQDTLAYVMKRLVHVSPLPTLYMRTVIKALSLYPRLTDFVLDILERLISKEVWRRKKVWEGFIICCRKLQPLSFQILLQLPTRHLADLFSEAPDLKNSLVDHITKCSESQKSRIPRRIMDVLFDNRDGTPD